MTLVPPKLKKVIFFGFCQKKYFMLTLFAKKCPQVKTLYIEKSHKKIQALSVNFDGISAISHKGRPKSEKNKGKKEQFSWVLSK